MKSHKFKNIFNSPIFLPDISTFFNQDFELADEMINKLMKTKVKFIKGEVLHDVNICNPQSGDEKYIGRKSNKIIVENTRKLIERKIVPLKIYEKMFKKCIKNGFKLALSVYDFKGLEFARDVGVSIIKIASSNIVHQPLIEKAASMKLPMIIDTGHSSIEEISRAVNWIRDKGFENFIIEHSPLAPPNPVSKHNLNFMVNLGKIFNLKYGLSDHHASEEMLYAATALGATVLEKGICMPDQGDEQDAKHALSIDKVPEVIKKIDTIHKALGSGTRNLNRNRKKYSYRMGIIAKKTLNRDDRINLKNVTFSFPCKGIPVEMWNEVFNKKINKVIKKNQSISFNDIKFTNNK